MKASPNYSLELLARKIDGREVTINQDVLNDAKRDFGWGPKEILEALKRLKQNHFVKSDPCFRNPNWMFDIYRAKKLHLGEDVYTHFYIHDKSGKLVINSFKKL